MINLIRNELKKIFSKKSLYIILVITVAFCIFANIMNKKFSELKEDDYIGQERSAVESQLEYAKEVDDIAMIQTCEAQLETIELVIKYPVDSWQRYCRSQLQEAISKTKMAISLEEKEKAQEDVDLILNSFKDDNWRAVAEKELENLNSEIELLNLDVVIDVEDDSDMFDSLKDEKQILEWRLEKGIPYGKSDLNAYLDAWRRARSDIRNFESEYKPSYFAKRENQTDIETVAICEYAIENGMDSNITEGGDDQLQYSLSTTAKSQLLEVFESFGFFIILASVMIAGTIVSEEFNKGTIKLLLVRPYKRTKILMAKFLTCVIVLLLSYVSVALIQTVVGGVVFGFDSYAEKTVMYSFNSNAIEQFGIVPYLIMSGLSVLPQYLLLMTLAFAIGVIVSNSPVAIVLPFVGIIASDFINGLAFNYNKAKFLLYFVTPNWDLSMYSFGRFPILEEMSLPFSISVCLIYFVVMLGISVFVFRRRDIKNV